MSTFFRALLIMLCCTAGLAMAEEKNILVTSGADRAIPVAVVPFGWQGGSLVPEDMAEIVGNDLRNSGFFEPIPRQNMISLPAQASDTRRPPGSGRPDGLSPRSSMARRGRVSTTPRNSAA